jgi:tRNA 2-thiouridine synthesizing protein C
MKKYLFVLRKPAHCGAFAQEMLDVILTTAAFEQQVSLLLLDDAVYQLKTNQHPEKVNLKDTASIFTALKIYDVNDVYIETESLAERGLTENDLILNVKFINRHAVFRLMAQADVIFSS